MQVSEIFPTFAVVIVIMNIEQHSLKRLAIIVLTAMCLSGAAAQEEERVAFSHMGVGVSVGTTALGINVSTVLSPYVGVRAGINIWPLIKLGRLMHFRVEDSDREPGYLLQHLDEVNAMLEEGEKVLPTIDEIMQVDFKVLPKLTAGHIVFDFFPFPRSSSFHFSAGAHIGTGIVVNVHNRYDGILMPITMWNNAMVNPNVQPVVEEYGLRRIGLGLGDYFLMPDENGNIDAQIRVSGFRPYLGLGFGRPVPHKRIGLQFDLGLQFWGSPRVYFNGEELQPNRVGDELDDILSIVSRIKAFPVLNVRLVGRIF